MSKTPLVRFSLDNVNCLIAAHSLNFLADVDEGMQIVVAGEYNSRKQFVVKKYSVIGKTKIMIEVEALKKTPYSKLSKEFFYVSIGREPTSGRLLAV